MITDIFDSILNESTNENYDDIQVPEPLDEGFEFEFGGISRANILAESAIADLEAAEMATSVKSAIGVLNESTSIEEVQFLQEAVVTKVIDAIKNVIQKLWARIKAICNSVKLRIEKTFSNSKFIVDAEKQLKGLTDFSGVSLEGYEFTLDAINLSKISGNLVDVFKKPALELASKIQSMKVSAKVENLKADIDKITENYKDNYGSTDKKNDLMAKTALGCTYSNVSSEVFKKLRNGSDTKKSITWNKDGCIKAVREFSTVKSNMDSISNDVDISYKKALKDIEAFKKLNETRAQGAEGNSSLVFSKASEIITDAARSIESCMTFTNKLANAKIQALKDQLSQSKSFIVKAISQGKKNLNASTDITGGNDPFASILNNY